MEQFLRDNLYKLGVRECAKELKISEANCRLKAYRLGLILTQEDRVKLKAFSPHYNAKFFDDWTEESSYVLGFIFADGTIGINHTKGGGKGIRLSISQSEVEVMQRILLAMKSDCKISKSRITGNRKQSYKINFDNPYLTKRVQELGVIPNKSNVRVSIPEIPGPYLRHFVRGFVDGDGCLSKDSGSNYWRISIFASEVSNIVPQIVSKMQLMGLPHPKLVKKAQKSTLDQAYWGSKECAVVVKWLYSDSTIFLSRKKQRAEEITRVYSV